MRTGCSRVPDKRFIRRVPGYDVAFFVYGRHGGHPENNGDDAKDCHARNTALGGIGEMQPDEFLKSCEIAGYSSKA